MVLPSGNYTAGQPADGSDVYNDLLWLYNKVQGNLEGTDMKNNTIPYTKLQTGIPGSLLQDLSIDLGAKAVAGSGTNELFPDDEIDGAKITDGTIPPSALNLPSDALLFVKMAPVSITELAVAGSGNIAFKTTYAVPLSAKGVRVKAMTRAGYASSFSSYGKTYIILNGTEVAGAESYNSGSVYADTVTNNNTVIMDVIFNATPVDTCPYTVQIQTALGLASAELQGYLVSL